MEKRSAVVWFRQDLRLHDNEAILEANRIADEVLYVYVFDKRLFEGNTDFGFPKIGTYRKRFVLESVADLRNSIRKKGADLVIRYGLPEEEVFELAKAVKSSWVFCNRERLQEEVLVQDALEKNLWSIGQEIWYTRGKMLFHTQDLPFPVTHTPDVFTQFRKEVERFVPIRAPHAEPETLKHCKIEVACGELPDLGKLGIQGTQSDERGVLHFIGGETEGLKRLHYYLWERDLVKTYKETRNGLLSGDYSTKFSPWLAQGCLSPKRIYSELKKYESERGGNESTYWVFFELLWRDFFRLMAKKHGNRIFLKGGTRSKPVLGLQNDNDKLERWIAAKTGVPFIDANMRELQLTGFMSNRGRQNVASFLVHDLKVNWQAGASYFESMLIDYDPSSNWGNWNYIAGVGSDPREDRYFNILTQAKKYDLQGDYVKHWLPELASVAPELIHQPDLWRTTDQGAATYLEQSSYPNSIVSVNKWR